MKGRFTLRQRRPLTAPRHTATALISVSWSKGGSDLTWWSKKSQPVAQLTAVQ